QDLLRAGHVTERAQTVRAATRDDVTRAPLPLQLRRFRLQRCRQVGATGYDGDLLSSQQPVEEVVAAGVLLVTVRHPLLEHQPAVEALRNRRRQRQPAVVRLHRAYRDQRVGTLRERVGNEELQFAGLVAARREAEQVVTLEVDLRAAQVAAQVL